MSTLLHTYILLIGCLSPIMLFAQKHYTKQSVYPIANFAWDENDTTRYEGHYRFEHAYKLIEDMLTDKRPLDFAEAVFAVENCMYDGKLDYADYSIELETGYDYFGARYYLSNRPIWLSVDPLADKYPSIVYRSNHE